MEFIVIIIILWCWFNHHLLKNTPPKNLGRARLLVFNKNQLNKKSLLRALKGMGYKILSILTLRRDKIDTFFIKFNNRNQLIIPDKHKLYASIWNFIHASCNIYFKVKNINPLEVYKLNKDLFDNFYEKYKIVNFEQVLDPFDNKEEITIYQNWFKNVSDKKDLSKKILEISNLLNYPAFVLEIIEYYSTMLITPYDENLYLIPNKEDRFALMNVNLDYFISTEQQLEIFIEALELNLKYNKNYCYSSYIEEFIKNLKNNYKKKTIFQKLFKFFYNCFLNFFEKVGQLAIIIFYLFSPIIIYSFLNYIFQLMPLIIIELLILWFLYFIIKFLLPFFKKKEYFWGLYCLLKKITFYCWTQKIFLFFLIPSFGWYISIFKTNNNLFEFFYFDKKNLIINYMFTIKDQAQKKIFSSFFDIGNAIKIIKLNPIFLEKDLLEKDLLLKKNLSGSLLYRSFYRTPTFYKKFLNTSLQWGLFKGELEKKNFFSNLNLIAQIHQDLAVKHDPRFNYIKNFFLNDLGHPNEISGSEMYISMILFDFLKNQKSSTLSLLEIQPADLIFNEHAVDLKLIFFNHIKNNKQSLYGEIKPGYHLLRGNNFEKNLVKIVSLLNSEREITGLGKELCLILDCTETDFQKVIKYRELLLKNNLEYEIFLIHKQDALSIKNILIDNLGILDYNDKNINKDLILDKKLSFSNKQRLLCSQPSFNNQTRDAFQQLQEYIPNIELPQNKEEFSPSFNNGYEGLEPGLLDRLFEQGF